MTINTSFHAVNVALSLAAIRGYDISTANFHLLDLLNGPELAHHLDPSLLDGCVVLLLEERLRLLLIICIESVI